MPDALSRPAKPDPTTPRRVCLGQIEENSSRHRISWRALSFQFIVHYKLPLPLRLHPDPDSPSRARPRSRKRPTVSSPPPRSLVHEPGFDDRAIELFGGPAEADQALRDITFALASASALDEFPTVLGASRGLRLACFQVEEITTTVFFRESADERLLHLVDISRGPAMHEHARRQETPDLASELPVLLQLSLLLGDLHRLVQEAEQVAPRLAPFIRCSLSALELVRGASFPLPRR